MASGPGFDTFFSNFGDLLRVYPAIAMGGHAYGTKAEQLSQLGPDVEMDDMTTSAAHCTKLFDIYGPVTVSWGREDERHGPPKTGFLLLGRQ